MKTRTRHASKLATTLLSLAALALTGACGPEGTLNQTDPVDDATLVDFEKADRGDLESKASARGLAVGYGRDLLPKTYQPENVAGEFYDAILTDTGTKEFNYTTWMHKAYLRPGFTYTFSYGGDYRAKYGPGVYKAPLQCHWGAYVGLFDKDVEIKKAIAPGCDGVLTYTPTSHLDVTVAVGTPAYYAPGNWTSDAVPPGVPQGFPYDGSSYELTVTAQELPACAGLNAASCELGGYCSLESGSGCTDKSFDLPDSAASCGDLNNGWKGFTKALCEDVDGCRLSLECNWRMYGGTCWGSCQDL